MPCDGAGRGACARVRRTHAAHPLPHSANLTDVQITWNYAPAGVNLCTGEQFTGGCSAAADWPLRACMPGNLPPSPSHHATSVLPRRRRRHPLDPAGRGQQLHKGAVPAVHRRHVPGAPRRCCLGRQKLRMPARMPARAACGQPGCAMGGSSPSGGREVSLWTPPHACLACRRSSPRATPMSTQACWAP